MLSEQNEAFRPRSFWIRTIDGDLLGAVLEMNCARLDISYAGGEVQPQGNVGDRSCLSPVLVLCCLSFLIKLSFAANKVIMTSKRRLEYSP